MSQHKKMMSPVDAVRVAAPTSAFRDAQALTPPTPGSAAEARAGVQDEPPAVEEHVEPGTILDIVIEERVLPTWRVAVACRVQIGGYSQHLSVGKIMKESSYGTATIESIRAQGAKLEQVVD